MENVTTTNTNEIAVVPKSLDETFCHIVPTIPYYSA